MSISFLYSKDFMKRALSTAVLMPVTLLIIYLGGYLFKALIIVAAVLMAFEWLRMVEQSNKKKLWKQIGVIYITLPSLSFLYLREQPDGLVLILFLASCVWATDIGAYICGTFFGGPKLVPKISPKKSWTGMVGGFICALMVSTIFSYLDVLRFQSVASITILISVLAQIGDLLESALKRNFHIKDSGSLIPGQGGVLDRLDSMVTASPVFAALVLLGA